MKKSLIIMVLLVVSSSLVLSSSANESFKFEKTSIKLNVGKNLTNVISSPLDEDQLPHFLKKGSVDTSLGVVDYDQRIIMGSSLTLTNFSDPDFKNREYNMGIKIKSGTKILTYEIVFMGNLTYNSLMNKKLFFLGKDYTVKEVNDSESSMMVEDSDKNDFILISGSEINFTTRLNDQVLNGLIVKTYRNANNASLIDKFTLEWVEDDGSFVALGNDVVMPTFNILKLRFAGMTYYVDPVNHAYDETYGNVFIDAWYTSPSSSSSSSASTNTNTQSSSPPSSKSCIDSDVKFGVPESYYVKGFVSSDNLIYEDVCISLTKLAEAVCSSSAGIFQEVLCSNGCQNGICLKENTKDNLSTPISNNPTSDSIVSSGVSEESGNSCPVGCNLNKVCVSVGYRTNDGFCDGNNSFSTQKERSVSCAHDYECVSNTCFAKQCIGTSWLEKVFVFFKRIFGRS